MAAAEGAARQSVPIRAKGIDRVELLQLRSQWGRPDVWPFLALYTLVSAKAVLHATRFEWWVCACAGQLLCNVYTHMASLGCAPPLTWCWWGWVWALCTPMAAADSRCRHMLTLVSYGLMACVLLHVLTFLATHWSTRLSAWVSACMRVRAHRRETQCFAVWRLSLQPHAR
jgi:hypothetical protein